MQTLWASSYSKSTRAARVRLCPATPSLLFTSMLPQRLTRGVSRVGHDGVFLRMCRWKTTVAHSKPHFDTDSCGIPTRPTWSVDELLSSYPRPRLSPATLERLHVLSALHPPAEGTAEHKALTFEMENLVKLVEAVKTADVDELADAGTSWGDSVPDGRIWAEGTGIGLRQVDPPNRVHTGQDLLAHASRTENGLYVVETDRPRR
ncbi:hypothetical protein K474DRAFT_151407 [Panus rudis PR-1116 ss-1]|nr:hypothetical protein K474DRAFT_151407 [Panus rudis PR-1116 ss-1]